MSTKNNLLHVIGVSHSVPDEHDAVGRHEDYQKVLTYLASNISTNNRVGIEAWQYSLKEILSWNEKNIKGLESSECLSFLNVVCNQLQKQGAIPVPLEAKRVYRIIRRRMKSLVQEEGWSMIEGDRLFQRLNLYRSVRLFDIAHQRKCDTLIVGAQHAYDLSLLGHPSVDLVISKLSWQKEQEEFMQKYAKQWMYEKINALNQEAAA